jgi:hypothetical protein
MQLEELIKDALVGVKPYTINEPVGKNSDKVGQTQVTTGKAPHYKFKWRYACAFSKWVPSNQFINSGV